MRGSPLLRLALTIAAMLLLMAPLHSLTTHREATRPPAPASASKAEMIHLTLTSTTVPFTFAVSYLGQVIWRGETTESSASKDMQIEFPVEGIELLLEASWPEGKLAAIKLEITTGDSEPLTRTLWGETKVSDVLTFTQR